MKKKSWDEARARQLLAEGLSDLDIADMVGASEGAIKAWRAKNRLHSNANPRKPRQPKVMPLPPAEEVSAAEESVSELPTTEQAPAVIPDEQIPKSKGDVDEPLPSGPVEISISYAGCNVMLTGPNHRTALWAAAYLNDIVDSLAPERERERDGAPLPEAA